MKSLLFEGQLEATNRAGMVLLKPRRKAVWVVHVATRHEHAFRVDYNRIGANSAHRRLQFQPIFLAMLLLNLDLW